MKILPEKFRQQFQTARLATVACVSACLLAPVAVSGQDMQTITRNLQSSYDSLGSLAIVAKVQSHYEKDFLKYREEAGYPLLIRSPSDKGEIKYLAREGMFGCDSKSWWGDGTPQSDGRTAWDGLNWQFLNRQDPSGHCLDIARKRTGAQESSAHMASPFDFGFPFLVAATARVANGMYPEDDFRWRITLDKMKDKTLWQGIAERLRGNVEKADYQGQACWKFTVNGGVARGDRTTKIDYVVWLPVASPFYPLRHETRVQGNNNLLSVFEVTEFTEPLGTGLAAPLKMPRKFRITSYTTDPRWTNKPVQVIEYEYTDCKLNHPLTIDDFKIDPALASSVRLLETGQTINLDKQRKGKER